MALAMVVAVSSLVVVASLLGAVSAQDSCYAFNNNPYLNFATKTAYEYAHNKRGIAPVPDCKPIQLWLVARHGTRWLSSDSIPEFSSLNEIRDHVISNYNANKGSLCLQDIENLKEWRFNLSPDMGDTLTRQGREDLYFLGRRIRSYFPELLSSTTYSPDTYLFRHTNTSRTKESAEYFARGVLGLNFDDSAPNLPPAIADDRLIYPYNNCPEWDSLSSASKQERKKFDNTEFMSNVVYNVSRRLGFDYNLTQDNVKNIYDGCRYTKAWNVTSTSPWCAAFNKEDLQVMEYSEDVKYYYKSGPGGPMNLKLACSLTKDMFNRFSAVEAGSTTNNPTGVFYFSHATMIDMLSARMGLADDSLPLMGDNYPEESRRQFRTSHIIPFAGNILAVLYNCTRGESLQTIFYQSEDIVRYPGCSVGLCEWNYIKQRFSSFVQDSACADQSYCFSKDGAQSLSGAHFGVLITLTVLLLQCLLT